MCWLIDTTLSIHYRPTYTFQIDLPDRVLSKYLYYTEPCLLFHVQNSHGEDMRYWVKNWARRENGQEKLYVFGL